MQNVSEGAKASRVLNGTSDGTSVLLSVSWRHTHTHSYNYKQQHTHIHVHNIYSIDYILHIATKRYFYCTILSLKRIYEHKFVHFAQSLQYKCTYHANYLTYNQLKHFSDISVQEKVFLVWCQCLGIYDPSSYGNSLSLP